MDADKFMFFSVCNIAECHTYYSTNKVNHRVTTFTELELKFCPCLFMICLHTMHGVLQDILDFTSLTVASYFVYKSASKSQYVFFYTGHKASMEEQGASATSEEETEFEFGLNSMDEPPTGEGTDTPRFERYKEQVRQYLQRSNSDELFTPIRGRCIPSLMTFHPQNDLSEDEVQQLKEKIVSLNEDFDAELSKLLGLERMLPFPDDLSPPE